MKNFILFLAAAAVSLTGCAHRTAEPAAPSPPATAADEQEFDSATLRADFVTLYDKLKSAHFDLYARVPRARYDRLHARMLAEIDRPETRAEAARRFQRFVAFGRIAHARIDENYRSWQGHLAGGGRAFPLTLRFRGDRAFVLAGAAGLPQIAIGDEVTAIEGRTIAEWLEAAHRNISADTDYMAGALLELDLPMLLWLELGPAAEFDLTVRKPGARSLVVNVPARTRAEIDAAARSEPPRLDLGAADRTAKMLGGGVAYLRPGPFYNADPNAADPYDNSRFRRFIDESFGQFLAADARALIVDLRDNPGGDSSFSDLMIAWFADKPFRFASAFRIKVSPEAIESNRKRLEASDGAPDSISGRFAALYANAGPGEAVEFPVPGAKPREGRRFDGKLFVLVNRNSYSNAVAVAATVQDYRFGTILGEETSDLATTYGAMETFTLPRTGISVGFPKAHIVRPDGSLEPRGVVPDVAIETPLLEGPDDPVLARAVALASAGPGP